MQFSLSPVESSLMIGIAARFVNSTVASKRAPQLGMAAHSTTRSSRPSWHEDMYVNADFSLETAARIGNVTTWITNEWQHDGGSASGGSVLDRLLTLAADLPPA